MKNLDKSQLPKLIALGMVAAGLLGYVVFSMFGKSTPTPAIAATPPVLAPPTVDPTTEPQNPVLQLAAIHHPDPFKPVFEPQTAPPPLPPRPAPKPPTPESKPQPPPAPLRDVFDSPPMDALPAFVKVTEVGGSGPSQPPPVAKPAPKPAPAAKPTPAPPPSPPAVVVTGILEGDENVAILKWNDSHRQVVRVGDRLEGGYVVKTIRPEAVVMARGSHQWTVRLGADRPESN